MADPRIVAIRVRRGNAVFNVHGDNAGREGVWLAAGQVNGTSHCLDERTN